MELDIVEIFIKEMFISRREMMELNKILVDKAVF
jgi:hypothetical protein